MAVFIKKFLFLILLFSSTFIIILHLTNHTEPANINYTLKAYKNTVALYNEDEIINIYDNIVLNTLPKNDIQNFNNGISFSSITQAEIYLEDFD